MPQRIFAISCLALVVFIIAGCAYSRLDPFVLGDRWFAQDACKARFMLSIDDGVLEVAACRPNRAIYPKELALARLGMKAFTCTCGDAHYNAFMPVWLAVPLLLVYPVIVFVVRPMRRRREPHDEPSCARCGYSLRGLPETSVRCPECGEPRDQSHATLVAGESNEPCQ